jgi:hypothetical protein
MSLPQKTFQAKMLSLKSTVDSLIGMEARGRLQQSACVDELALMILEVGKAINESEPKPDGIDIG